MVGITAVGINGAVSVTDQATGASESSEALVWGSIILVVLEETILEVSEVIIWEVLAMIDQAFSAVVILMMVASAAAVSAMAVSVLEELAWESWVISVWAVRTEAN